MDDTTMYSNFFEMMLIENANNTSMQNTFNYYNFLNADQKLYFRNKDYLTIIQDMLTEMFDIDGLTLTQKCYLLKGVVNNGMMFLRKDEKSVIIAPCHFKNTTDEYNIFPDEYIVDKGNFHKSGKLDKNECVVYLTPDRLPLSIINRYTTMLSDVDTSMVNNIIYCRISPIISAYNDKGKQAYSECIDNMIRGELKNVILDTINMNTLTASPVTVSDISKADYATKIQCLSMFHQDLISRLAMLFGVDYKHLDKQANALESEMRNGDDYMMIYPRLLLRCLKESLSTIGMNVKFNSIWTYLNEDTEKSSGSEKSDEKSSGSEKSDEKSSGSEKSDEKSSGSEKSDEKSSGSESKKDGEKNEK